MNRTRHLIAVLAATTLAVGCDDTEATIPTIDGTATVDGVVYLDIDGSEGLSGFDEPVEGGVVNVTTPGGGPLLASDTTGLDGVYSIPDLPVGTFDLGLDADFLGDSLLVVPLDSTRFSLAEGQTLSVAQGVTFPVLSIQEAREAATGRRIFTQGVVLNPRGQAPGGAIHVEGGDVAVRVLVPPAALGAVGDSVRILALTGRDLGQPALTDARIFRLVQGARDVVPRPTTIAQARVAAGGRAADLVEVTEGSVTAVETVPEGFRVTLTEGSDTVSVRLRTEQGFVNSGAVEDAVVIRVVGLLVPDEASGDWMLVPRTVLDWRLGPPPTAGRR